jgi:predicted aconitase with swiveling domain
MLEKNLGSQMRVILDPAYGFEGTLVAITREPAGIWLSNAEAIVLRATIAQPIPQVASREERSEIFLHLNSVQRIEVLHSPSKR